MKKAVILLVIAVTALRNIRDRTRPAVGAAAGGPGLRRRFQPDGRYFSMLRGRSFGRSGNVVLRPPLSNDLIVAPTREIVGIEDPFLQLAGAPNYFNAAWRARSFLKGADGRTPERDEIAVVANSAIVRNSGPTPHPRGLPQLACQAHSRGGCAERPDWQMGADHRRGSEYGLLGDAHQGSRLKWTPVLGPAVKV